MGSGARSVSVNAKVNSHRFESPPAEICGDLRKPCGSQRLQNLRVPPRSGSFRGVLPTPALVKVLQELLRIFCLVLVTQILDQGHSPMRIDHIKTPIAAPAWPRYHIIFRIMRQRLIGVIFKDFAVRKA